ncbi:deoxyribose-phosphate aldolase [Halanaerobium saccharolyticum]|jgi:deoxyribose-phosphate aldolase|uniref:Deoxyribose-phosphate aldolase n=1 Tax=Halanaerobium saccharolyticum TaxID=43595 RepID=A0A2T5RG04_9FIRM|nr:deoxyribose-phosphate aldolase [Halanaerobium saccharolyticum]PTV93270.1 deoxyribose-phosphate aldolase [Halanaerobium saccharolyticum]TDP87836.1 deoxyribose-phosphate aldolase [Halanaerobium saccharolyticum]
MTKEEVAGMIDHTILGAEVTKEAVKEKCREAKEYNFASVCANPDQVALMTEELADSPVKVCTVIGFPLGVNATATKIAEAELAAAEGADELDMVIKVGALKEGDYELVKNDIKAVVEAAGDKVVKVIIETCYLTDQQKVKACELAKAAGADFVKTSTGFGSGGATVEDIALMRKTVGEKMGVKASGGIHSLAEAEAMIEAGATRIGASSGVQIIEGAEVNSDY